MFDSKKRSRTGRTLTKPISTAFNDGFDNDDNDNSLDKTETKNWNNGYSTDETGDEGLGNIGRAHKVLKTSDNIGDGNGSSRRLRRSQQSGKPDAQESTSAKTKPLSASSNNNDHIPQFVYKPGLTTVNDPGNPMPEYTDSENMQYYAKYEVEIPWVDKYQPKTIEEVALHHRKKKDVIDAVETVMDPSSKIRVLILSGPAGTSKSTILKTAFKEKYHEKYGYNNTDPDIVEYETPDSRRGVSLVHHFTDFLAGCRYRGNNQNVLIVVEDLPNIAHFDTKREFNRAIADWIYRPVGIYETPPPCLAIIITEVEAANDTDPSSRNALSRYTNPSSIITECILIPEILNHYQLRRIKFNKIARTIAKKTLKSIATQESNALKKLSSADLTKVLDLLSLYGDIRSSIATFDFWTKSLGAYLQRNSTSLTTSNRVVEGKDTKGTLRQTIDFYFNLMKHDSSLDIFHAIGKVVYRSMKDNEGNVVSDPEIVVNSVVNDWGKGSRGDQQSFENLLFENYLPFNSEHASLDNVLQCLDSLYIGNLIATNTSTYSSGGALATELASEIEVRGIRYALRSRHNSSGGGFRKLSGPRFLSIKRDEKALKFQEEIANLQQQRIKTCKTIVDLDPLIQYENFYLKFIDAEYQRTEPYRTIYKENTKGKGKGKEKGTKGSESVYYNTNGNKSNVESAASKKVKANELVFSDDFDFGDFETFDDFDDIPHDLLEGDLDDNIDEEKDDSKNDRKDDQKDGLPSTLNNNEVSNSSLSPSPIIIEKVLVSENEKGNKTVTLSDNDLNDDDASIDFEAEFKKSF